MGVTALKITHRIGVLFAVIGLGLLLFCVFSYRSTSAFIDAAAGVPGTVVDLARSTSSSTTSSGSSSTYRPVVSFQDKTGQEHEFIASVGSNPPSHRKGDVVEVLYLGGQEQEAKINSFVHLWFSTVLFGGMGLVFASTGLGLVLPSWIRRKSHERLRQSGTPVIAKVQQVVENRRQRRGGRHPYQVVAQWQSPRTGEIHVFKSENIWFDPGPHLGSDELTVFIERDNPKKYYVDLTMLPKLAD